jgi:hypothetical protein
VIVLLRPFERVVRRPLVAVVRFRPPLVARAVVFDPVVLAAAAVVFAAVLFAAVDLALVLPEVVFEAITDPFRGSFCTGVRKTFKGRSVCVVSPV